MDPYTDHLDQQMKGGGGYNQPLASYRGQRYHNPFSTFQEDAGDGVYMFVKFPTNNGAAVGVVRQTVVLAQRPLQTVRGRFVGIARKIWDMSPGDWTEEAVVVFWFSSLNKARTFFVSDDRMKQPDFPAPAGVCDAWAVVRYYTPENELAYNTFMISEVQLRGFTSYEAYREYYAKNFAHLLLRHGAQPFVVQSVGAEALRRHYVPHNTIVVVHLFKDPAHLAEIKRDREWQELAMLHRDMAFENCSVFTIDPRACP